MQFVRILMNFMIFENDEKRSTHTTHTTSVQTSAIKFPLLWCRNMRKKPNQKHNNSIKLLHAACKNDVVFI